MPGLRPWLLHTRRLGVPLRTERFAEAGPRAAASAQAITASALDTTASGSTVHRVLGGNRPVAPDGAVRGPSASTSCGPADGPGAPSGQPFPDPRIHLGAVEQVQVAHAAGDPGAGGGQAEVQGGIRVPAEGAVQGHQAIPQ